MRFKSVEEKRGKGTRRERRFGAGRKTGSSREKIGNKVEHDNESDKDKETPSGQNSGNQL